MLGPYPFTLFANPRAGTPGMTVLPEAGFRRARAEIVAWPGYAPTPLVDLPGIAAAAGLGVVRLKDEAGRFGLGSFKALGGAVAGGDRGDDRDLRDRRQSWARGGLGGAALPLPCGDFYP